MSQERLLFEEPTCHILSEARSEMNMKEPRVAGAHTALRQTGQQIQSQRVGLYQATQSSDFSRRVKDWLCTELEENERALQEGRMRSLQEIEETRVKSLQEIEELKKMCCAEAEESSTVENG